MPCHRCGPCANKLPAAAGRWLASVRSPTGRLGGKQLAQSPIKQYAAEQGLPVLQPTSLRKDPAAVAALAALAPDLIVVAAYGLILPPSVLSLPTYGCINVHASLLPAYRGASPITAAILDGRSETGATIMLVMDAGMDTGPALRQVTEPILPADTTASLSERLAEAGRPCSWRRCRRGWKGILPRSRRMSCRAR